MDATTTRRPRRVASCGESQGRYRYRGCGLPSTRGGAQGERHGRLQGAARRGAGAGRAGWDRVRRQVRFAARIFGKDGWVPAAARGQDRGSQAHAAALGGCRGRRRGGGGGGAHRGGGGGRRGGCRGSSRGAGFTRPHGRRQLQGWRRR